MKIQGPNHSNFNPYQKQIQKQQDVKVDSNQKDQLQISKHAQQLQENTKPDPAREKYVEQIKQAVDAGDYQVDAQKTAKKIVDFWNTQA